MYICKRFSKQFSSFRTHYSRETAVITLKFTPRAKCCKTIRLHDTKWPWSNRLALSTQVITCNYIFFSKEEKLLLPTVIWYWDIKTKGHVENGGVLLYLIHTPVWASQCFPIRCLQQMQQVWCSIKISNNNRGNYTHYSSLQRLPQS